jgi:hypothetical protein
MALRITIDVFSGRPNPTFTLDDDASKELLERLRPGKRLKKEEREAPPESVLGYRGIVVEQLRVPDPKVVGRAALTEPGELPEPALPPTFRVVDGKLFGPKLAHVPSDPNVEDWICGSTGPIRLAHLPDELLEIIRQLIKDRIHLRFPWPGIKWPTKLSCRCAPLYEPTWWNDAGQRQYNNNCYNYGTNYRTDTFAQPGLGSGAMYASITCPEVRAAATRDDLIQSPKADNKCPKEGHLAALVVGPGWDFHWYRKGRNGLWTHKPGGTAVTNVDNSGNLITDPRTADRGGYTDFCTFFTVMHGHTKIR